ncbi:hypothetical protein Xszus_03865 [Xenorhabdus szentirmaii]|nr:hypothetical protein Xsze_01708 [Xenorhabdus szentirmaii DSM 16338]PHM44041.1 hypothetical protein Xszus_03865 [Xenorhabdus szentirmaii]
MFGETGTLQEWRINLIDCLEHNSQSSLNRLQVYLAGYLLGQASLPILVVYTCRLSNCRFVDCVYLSRSPLYKQMVIYIFGIDLDWFVVLNNAIISSSTAIAASIMINKVFPASTKIQPPIIGNPNMPIK